MSSEDIKNTVLELIRDLKDNVLTQKTEQGELLLVEFFFKNMTAASLSNHIVTYVLPHEKRIAERDISFFIKEKSKIFASLPTDRIDHFVQLVTSPSSKGGISAEDRDVVWSYFDCLVDLAKKYKKIK